MAIEYLNNSSCKIEKQSMYHPSEFGQRQIIDYMLEQGNKSFDDGLAGSCMGGFAELANLMMEKGAKDFDRAFESACFSGNEELIDILLEKGAKTIQFGELL